MCRSRSGSGEGTVGRSLRERGTCSRSEKPTITTTLTNQEVNHEQVSVFLHTTLLSVLSAAAAGQDGAELLRQSGIQGGVVVHLGCGDGSLTAQLGGRPAVRRARSGHRRGQRRGGPPAVAGRGALRPRDHRPLGRTASCRYVDNFVNLIVAQPAGVETPRRKSCGSWSRAACRAFHYGQRTTDTDKTVKPWPAEMDQWTHYLHGPDGNPDGERHAGRAAHAAAVAGRSGLGAASRPHGEHERAGLRQRPLVLHPGRRLAGLNPAAVALEPDRPRRVQRHGPVETRDSRVGQQGLRAEERPGAPAAAAGGGRRPRLCHPGHRRAGHDSGRGHRQDVERRARAPSSPARSWWPRTRRCWSPTARSRTCRTSAAWAPTSGPTPTPRTPAGAGPARPAASWLATPHQASSAGGSSRPWRRVRWRPTPMRSCSTTGRSWSAWTGATARPAGKPRRRR